MIIIKAIRYTVHGTVVSLEDCTGVCPKDVKGLGRVLVRIIYLL